MKDKVKEVTALKGWLPSLTHVALPGRHKGGDFFLV